MENSVKSFTPKEIFILSLDGTELDITPLCPVFQYYEDIDEPFVKAALKVIDSGVNLIQTLPIQGGELVTIVMNCAGSGEDGVTKELQTYQFRVWKVFNRIFDYRVQSYSLALLPTEAFTNEYQKVVKKLEGKPSTIVNDLLKNYLQTDEYEIETTGNNVSFYPGRKSVTSIIKTLQERSISEKGYKNLTLNNKSQKSKVPSENDENNTTIRGTAGYFFFQNKNGFCFKSIDKVCDDGKNNFDGNPIIGTYYATPVTETGTIEAFYTIEKYGFTSEIDLLDKMRRGVYSSKVVTYNFTTGQYDEFTYSLEDTFENMATLGYQDNLPKFTISDAEDKKLPPTRVMSMVVDHETWNYDDVVADPEQGGTAKFPDDTKYLIAQGIARRNTLELQKLQINIPGNSSLVVGEKIKVYLPNMATEGIRKTDRWDRESSGNYLISKLSHNFLMANESGPIFETSLTLIRDTYGMEEEPSQVK